MNRNLETDDLCSSSPERRDTRRYLLVTMCFALFAAASMPESEVQTTEARRALTKDGDPYPNPSDSKASQRNSVPRPSGPTWNTVNEAISELEQTRAETASQLRDAATEPRGPRSILEAEGKNE